MTRMEKPPTDLFRQEAYEHQLRGADLQQRLMVSPPWSWWLVWLVVGVLTTALVLAIVGSIEVNARAVAILRPGDGVRLFTAQVAGSVHSVQARSGEQVRAGDIVLTLDAPGLQGQMLQSQREVDLLASEYGEVSRRQQVRHEQQVASVHLRIEQMQGQIASQRTSLAAFEHKWNALQSLADSGVVSRMSVIEAQEAHAQASRQLASARQGLQQTRQELAMLASQREADQWQQQQALKTTQSRHEALQLSLRQTIVRAPQAGTVEAVLVEPGDVVAPGTALGKLVPTGAPLRVVSFLPEKDRAFVKVGDAVRLELAQLPYGEYGSLGARVTRIGTDLASAYEVQEVLGDNDTSVQPSYRVELEVTDAAAAQAAGIRLRSGMLMQTRFTLRRERPITMLLEPLRRWFR